jgi:PGF-CTERM protein
VAYRYDDGRFRPVGAATRTSDELHFPAPETSQYVAVVAHRDTDGDGVFDRGQDPPYRVGDEPVHEWLPVRVDDEPVPESPPAATFSLSTPTSTPSPTPTNVHTTVTPTATPTPTRTAPWTTTTVDGPGFGPLVALLALVLVGLVARRRR